MMSTKCAASTRGIVRMVALPRACCRRALRPVLWKVGTPHPSRSWPQGYNFFGICFVEKSLQVGKHSFFHGSMFDTVNTFGDSDSERLP